MTAREPRPAAVPTPDLGDRPRRRDAAGTRQLLLEAARRRFARDGYTATTVRDIAEEAGVNVALISRYFTSKEGLFEACLVGAVDELGRTVAPDVTLERLPGSMARQLAGPDLSHRSNQLLLLLRSSSDPRANQIRLDTLRYFAERLATAAGWHSDHPEGAQLMLNAQITLAAAFGIALLRSSADIEPLSSASQEDLVGPLHDLIHALLAGT